MVGRCIQRLVSLTARVEDLVNESDQHACLDDFKGEHTKEQDRMFKAYNKLLGHQPFLRRAFESEGDVRQLVNTYKELNKGADATCGDDAASLKPVVVQWLMSAEPGPEPLLEPDEKDGRGFDHDITGHLLCPVDYDWNNPHHRAAICDYHPEFLVTAYSWPTFLYENGRYDPNRPSNGLFKGALLVRAFKHIFTSPTSALKMNLESNGARLPLKKRQKYDEQRTRCHVASLVGMKSVCPRAITYIAVQLRFALSSCGSWRIVDGEFNYDDFYNNIIDFFENTGTAGEKKVIQDLLLWWNRSVALTYFDPNYQA
ncbi:hypothetical protein SCLCIDRAFT_112399 [Scleroderma citrinum Foug A]|uniref:Uncharacterized protein n=1 Tax=Scleroderma citrinum Foug A TaxID=1036808 RepID=A0A0C3DYF6_9AGAM|nr:hypothetical protein SCLCIDRAFT_112399 [Scleroderma citrinum Foug A]